MKKIFLSQLFSSKEYKSPLLSSVVKKKILKKTIGQQSLVKRILSYSGVGTLAALLIVVFLHYGLGTRHIPINESVTQSIGVEDTGIFSENTEEKIKTDYRNPAEKENNNKGFFGINSVGSNFSDSGDVSIVGSAQNNYKSNNAYETPPEPKDSSSSVESIIVTEKPLEEDSVVIEDYLDEPVFEKVLSDILGDFEDGNTDEITNIVEPADTSIEGDEKLGGTVPGGRTDVQIKNFTMENNEGKVRGRFILINKGTADYIISNNNPIEVNCYVDWYGQGASFDFMKRNLNRDNAGDIIYAAESSVDNTFEFIIDTDLDYAQKTDEISMLKCYLKGNTTVRYE